MQPTNTDRQEIEQHLGRAATDEQAADLAALQARASPPGQPQEVQGGGAAAQQGPSQQALQLAALAVAIIKPLACYAVPALAKAPAELWEPIPQGLAGVIDHYDLGDHISNPWFGLALASAPLAAYALMETAKEAQQQPQAQQIGGPDLSAPATGGAQQQQAGAAQTVTFSGA